MKRVRFNEKAERLNIPVQTVITSFKKLLSEGKVYGVIDYKNGEFVYCTPKEIDELSKFLESKRIALIELAKKCDLKTEQARLIIDKLLEEGKIKGAFSQDGAFISTTVLRNLVIASLKETTNIDVQEMAHKLSVSNKEVELVVEELGELVDRTTASCSQIRLTDISRETGLPENLIIALLKTLILDGKIAGSLDLVTRVLIREPLLEEKAKATTIEKAEPSALWWLLPIFFGILGGIIAYVGVKDDDRNMAENLLFFSILLSVILILIVGPLLWPLLFPQ
jgi:DNA-binding transcriptional regulator YhcF (GntR family)